jgi:hypothetical protein
MLNGREMTPVQHQGNLRDQAGKLSVDSKGVVQGFVLAQQTIQGANQVLADALAKTADQQRAADPSVNHDVEGGNERAADGGQDTPPGDDR